MAHNKIRAAVNGYGVIGKRVADAIRLQPDIELVGVSDVVSELEGRLTVLKRQAQKAERYKRYREEQRDLELWTASHRFLELETTGRVLGARQEELGEQVEGLKNELGARETRLEAQRLELTELNRAFTERQEALFALESRIQLAEQDRKFQLQEREGLERSLEQSETEVEVVRGNLGQLEEELSRVDAEAEGLATDDDDGEAATEARLADEHDSIRDQLRTSEQERDRLRREQAALVTELATLEARLNSRAEGLVDLESRVQGMSDELAEVEQVAKDEGDRLADATEAREHAEARVTELREGRGRLDLERTELRDALRKSEVEVETHRKELVRARSRLQSLEEIQSRYRGCASGVQVVMEHRDELAGQAQLSPDGQVSGSGSSGSSVVHGIMADYITTPERYEAAVSAVLGDRLQGVVVEAPEHGARGVELLKQLQEGRTAFLPRSARGAAAPASSWASPGAATGGGIEVVDLSDQPNGQSSSAAAPASELPGPESGVLGRLTDLVDVDGRVDQLARSLLGQTVVVDELPRALELWQRGQVKDTMVTLDGDRIEPSGVVVGGASDALDSALLQQKREIAELEQVVAQLEEVFETAQARRQGLAERLAEVEEARERGEEEVLAAEKARLGATQELEDIQRAVQRAERDADSIRKRRADLQAELERRGEERVELEESLADARERKPGIDETLDELVERCEELAARREQVAEQLSEARVALARMQQQRDALAATRGRLSKQAGSERDRIRRLEEGIEGSRKRTEEIDADVARLAEEHTALLDEHKDATEAKHDAHEAYEAARLGVDELDASIRNLRKDYDEQREQLSDVELGMREHDIERGHVLDDVRERYGLVLQEVLVDFHARPMAGKAERDRIAELKRILSRMGEVNLTAIAEYEEVSERYEYLTGQKADLEDAIMQLEEAIEKINATTRERFKETFDKVNEVFKQVFPRLFAGGRAELRMTDPSDVLETGVEIFAQPPGKKIVSLELLSGGEKALTATSLIFAIFLIKPSPFCLLDEVDAPLDEANVGRFCGLVKELSERTQFIIITHNKRTMEIADQLYGVTMQQKGISKLVSVNLRKQTETAEYEPPQPQMN